MALAWALARAVPVLASPFEGRGWVALACVATGGACGLLGILTFRRASTTLDPHRPEDAATLVTTGIYRATRNPMYLGLAMILVGWIVWLAHPLAIAALCLFVAWITRFQILPEERALRAAFRERYDHYRERTRRWL
jgi:protein-S-isoprenylcysteine O-methyltransferase Ste14